MAKTATAKLKAAQASRNNVIEERTLLVAWLTRILPATTSHLAPASITSDTTLWNWVVCIHSKAGALAWRISDFEAEAYFKHLGRHQCDDAPDRETKLARLADLASL